MFTGFAMGGMVRSFSYRVSVCGVALILAGCTRSAPTPESTDAAGQSASSSSSSSPAQPTRGTAGQGATAGSPAGSRSTSSSATAAEAGSIAATVARLEQVLNETNDAFFEGDVEKLGQSIGSVRGALKQLQSLLPRTKLDPERARAAAKAVADLSACCSQAETRMRGGKEVEQAEMQSFAQRVESALGAIKASTDGVP